MTDEQKALVYRLRGTYTERYSPTYSPVGDQQSQHEILSRQQPFNPDGAEAADLIEAQAVEIARLREALDWAIAEIEGRTIYPGSDQFTSEQQFENALECALAALAQETQP